MLSNDSWWVGWSKDKILSSVPQCVRRGISKAPTWECPGFEDVVMFICHCNCRYKTWSKSHDPSCLQCAGTPAGGGDGFLSAPGNGKLCKQDWRLRCAGSWGPSSLFLLLRKGHICRSEEHEDYSSFFNPAGDSHSGSASGRTGEMVLGKSYRQHVLSEL